MTQKECWDRVRWALSDRSGVLRFESFDVVDVPECGETACGIRRYLAGRTLAEVDTSQIREIGHNTHPLCAQVIAQMVAEAQETFASAPADPTRQSDSRENTGA